MAALTPQWPMFSQVLRRQALMDDMMEASGVDLLALVGTGEDFVKARSRCRACLHEDACRTWFLEDGGAQRQPPHFCPNAQFFLACKREDR